MLAELLNSEDWQPVTSGVRMYKLSADRLQEGLYPISSQKESFRQICMFFCCGGTLQLHRKSNPPLQISEQELLLFSDSSDVHSVQISVPPVGYLITFEREALHTQFAAYCRLFALSDPRLTRVEALLNHSDGCMSLRSTAWTRSLFSILMGLPFQEQGRYCLMKIFEISYLLCAHQAALEESLDLPPAPGYSVRTIRGVRAYMETHLDEKLTILSLSRQFHLSATALKNGFRSLFGVPIHTWLQEKRIQRAAELLSFSEQNVLQVAQSVGYEGVSQFNVLFKRKYGVTPSQYRKMSDTMNF